MKIINRIPNEQLPTRINFGCGNNLLVDYLNIDATAIREMKPDEYFVAIGELLNPQDLPNDWFTEIKAQMVFEHISIDIIPSILYTMSCLLKIDGRIDITVPNFEYFALNFEKYNSNKMTIEDLIFIREATFQLLDPLLVNISGRGHKSLWTTNLAKLLFESEGFVLEIDKKSISSPILKFKAVKKNKFSMPMVL